MFAYPVNAIKALILGCRSSERLEREVRVLTARSEYSHFKLYRMSISDETFKLRARSLKE